MRLEWALDGCHIFVARRAQFKMLRHRQTDNSDLEAGGVLVGRIAECGDLYIDDVSEPFPEDVRGRFHFEESARHQEFVTHAFKHSEGWWAYLGGWHTHAEPHPNPSPTDLASWTKQATDMSFDAANLINIIVGQEQVNAWLCDRNGHILKLRTG